MTAPTLVLGQRPDSLTVILVTGSDYSQTLHLSAGDWDGVVLTLMFDGGQTWTASADPSSSDATFAEAHTVADLIPAGADVALVATTDGSPLVWARGRVSRA